MKHVLAFVMCAFGAIYLNAQNNPVGGVGADTGIIDLHCHPSLKMYLFNAHLWKPHCSQAGMNVFDMQIDTRMLSKHTVKGFMATHYLLEGGFVKKSILRFLAPLFKAFNPAFLARIENEDYTNFAQINNMLDVFEIQVRNANNAQNQVKLVVVKNYREFEDAIRAGLIPVAHAIEGGHALGRNMAVSKKGYRLQHLKKEYAFKIAGDSIHPLNLSQDRVANFSGSDKTNYRKYRKIKSPAYGQMKDGAGPETKYIQNLDALFHRGVCMMSLSHFLHNDFTDPTEGVSPDAKKGACMKFGYNPAINNVPLTPVGVSVVERMLQIGMIVDLTHTNPTARQQIFEINYRNNQVRISHGLRPRPLIFSHAGVQDIFNAGDKNGTYHNYGFYDVSNAEIDSIKACRGVIGIIPENFWLKACNRKINKSENNGNRGIPFIIATIEHIHQRTGTYENIAIGSDFDGLADSPGDLYNPSMFGALIHAMRKANISEEDIARMTHLNALRVLREGWGD